LVNESLRKTIESCAVSSLSSTYYQVLRTCSSITGTCTLLISYHIMACSEILMVAIQKFEVLKYYKLIPYSSILFLYRAHEHTDEQIPITDISIYHR